MMRCIPHTLIGLTSGSVRLWSMINDDDDSSEKEGHADD